MVQVIVLIVGLLVGGLVGWLLANARQSGRFQAEREQRVAAETRLEEIEKRLDDQRSLVEKARAQLGDTFKALSSDALRQNAQTFVDRAKEAMAPLGDALKRYEDHLREIETARQQAYGSLGEQLKSLLASEQQLQRETGNLVTALRRPQVRGRWGELTLRRAVELAGMSDHVDYEEQVTAQSEGGRLRPDMIVYLPAGRQVVVDAKVPLDAYLSALEAQDDEGRQAWLTQHCQQIRAHIRTLSAKSYWEQFEPTPEFVVMFVPGESFLQAACEVDHTLIEDGMKERVVLASPTTLVALLRAVAYGWRQEQMAKNAQQAGDLGRELYDRLGTFLEHLAAVGTNLKRATGAFNQAVGSMESRVLPSARRFQDLGVVGGEELPTLEPVDTQTRELEAPEAAGE